METAIRRATWLKHSRILRNHSETQKQILEKQEDCRQSECSTASSRRPRLWNQREQALRETLNTAQRRSQAMSRNYSESAGLECGQGGCKLTADESSGGRMQQAGEITEQGNFWWCAIRERRPWTIWVKLLNNSASRAQLSPVEQYDRRATFCRHAINRTTMPNVRASNSRLQRRGTQSIGECERIPEPSSAQEPRSRTQQGQGQRIKRDREAEFSSRSGSNSARHTVTGLEASTRCHAAGQQPGQGQGQVRAQRERHAERRLQAVEMLYNRGLRYMVKVRAAQDSIHRRHTVTATSQAARTGKGS